ncbi:MAG TPA: restriction endonuclease subunit S [Solirubrobacterales bacterium]|nr:restriction endonuclease subunit S [Solirubrobacterales bacterium]
MKADSIASTIGNFNAERYSRVPLPWWPISQQRAIARYLDRETTRISTLITAKHKAVALLHERFRSAIFHEITGGDTAGPDRKESGLEWAETIPVDWATPPVAANFEVQLGKMLNPAASAGLDQRPYLRNVNVQWDRFDLDDVATMHFGSNDQRIYSLRAGDLLVCEGGEVGRAAIWQEELPECYFQKALHRLRPKGEANPRYLLYCLWGAANHGVFAVEGNLSTIVHLTREQLMAHRFPWPPARRQQEIVARLDALGATTRSAIARIERQIELLQERRQALITAAVTGELDIPGAG